MSFQTVKCPECGSSQVEYINTDQPVKCNTCKKPFSPFKPIAVKPATSLKKQVPTAERLVASIELVTDQLGVYLEESNLPSVKDTALKSIKLEMPVLLTTITDSIKKDKYDLKAAFQTEIRYSPLSQEPQRLDFALTYLYKALQYLDHTIGSGLFDDHNHKVLAESLIAKHSIALNKIVNP